MNLKLFAKATSLALLSPVLLPVHSAAAENCAKQEIYFQPSEQISEGCSKFTFRSTYTLSTCEDQKGLLTDRNGIPTPVFLAQNRWVARTDTYNFNDGVASTELLTMDLGGRTFFWSKNAVETGTGKVVRTLECAGALVIGH